MTISVIIPAYNEEKFLPETLKSIHNLIRKPDEIIIVDGGSTDKTAQIGKSYKAKVLTVEHRGIGYARQIGLEKATCDIVAYTDADTIVPNDWLSKIEESLSDPVVSAVYSGYYVTDSWFIYYYFINYLQPLIFYFGYNINMYLGGGQNIAFWKNKGIKSGGFPVNFKSVEDFEILKRLKTVGKVIYRTDNFVTSSGRRGNEGFSMITRVLKGFFIYFTTGKADKFDFPDIR